MTRRNTDATALDRSKPAPLWSQLLDDITRRLTAGAFTERFPGEHELVAEYRVSRHTVREALRRLREDGVLESARGRGTRIHLPEIEQPVGALYSLFRVVESHGLEQRSVVRALDVRTDARVARRLQLPDGTELVYLERLRMAGGEPLALDRVWLPRDVAEALLDADFTHAGLYDELVRRAGIRLTGGREHIQAVVPTPTQRRVLKTGRTVAAFSIERRGCLDNRPVEWRVTLVRGDRFSLSAQWAPRSGYQIDVASGAGPETVTSS
ncbi:MAG: GntR family transcriptional regulator [Pseudonocardiales bacterium]|nr:GntR family transcriptional regulator [Pseudonocardiales bacterium]